MTDCVDKSLIIAKLLIEKPGRVRFLDEGAVRVFADSGVRGGFGHYPQCFELRNHDYRTHCTYWRVISRSAIKNKPELEVARPRFERVFVDTTRTDVPIDDIVMHAAHVDFGRSGVYNPDSEIFGTVIEAQVNMNLNKLRKLLRNLKKRVRKFLPEPAYDPKEFFKARHRLYGGDLRSVGNCTLSVEENEEAYAKAKQVFLALCAEEKVNFKTVNALDIGCGTGFYTQTLHESGVIRYTGVDIIEDRFPDLGIRFPDYSFRQLDVREEQLASCYDLIVMIDVTQHIVDDTKFSAAMQNIRSHLADNGLFIVTSWLTDERTKRTYYEIARPMGYYTKEFPDCRFSEVLPFRDKFLFAIRKTGT